LTCLEYTIIYIIPSSLHTTIKRKHDNNNTKLTLITSIGVDAMALPRLAMKLELKQNPKLVMVLVISLLHSTNCFLSGNEIYVCFKNFKTSDKFKN
jgi:hypothetical protein